MKRTSLLFALLLLMGAGAWYAWKYQQKTKTGSSITPEMDFGIQHPEEIYKIFLADRNGRTATLTREGDHWMYNKTIRARQTAVDLLLQTMQKLKVYYIPAEAAEPNMIKSIASEGIKVEIYDKEGKQIKVYYVGGVTPDESGTYMMMEGAEHPYVTHIPTMIGSVRVQYRLEPEEWYDRIIFREKPETIQSISVEYPQNKSESFKLEKTGDLEYSVSPFYSTTPVSHTPQRKGTAEAYLLNFEKLGVEAHETLNDSKDSLMAMVPFAIVKVRNIDGTEKQATFWPVEEIYDESTKKLYNIRYLTACDWGPLVLTQHQVFGPIFRGYSHFFTGKSNKNIQ